MDRVHRAVVTMAESEGGMYISVLAVYTAVQRRLSDAYFLCDLPGIIVRCLFLADLYALVACE